MSRIVRPNGTTPASVSYTPLTSRASPPSPARARLKSRRQKTPAELTIQPYLPGAPYGWVEPPVWQDGAVYGASELNQQLLVNPERTMRPLIVVDETWTENISVPTYVPALNFPLAANETWFLKYRLIMTSTDDWFQVWRAPAGTDIAGTGTYLDNGGAVFINDQIAGAGPTYFSWWGFGWSFGTTFFAPFFSEVLVNVGSTPGILEFGFDVNASGQMQIMAGSTILGVKAGATV